MVLNCARPRTRGDCADGPRPCPWVACRFHLAVSIWGATVRLRPDWEQLPTCALDLAEKGGLTLREVGAVLGVTRQAAQQIESRALVRFLSTWGSEHEDP